MGAVQSLITIPGEITEEESKLRILEQTQGCDYPGSDYRPADRKNWMLGLNPTKVHLNKIVWPGSHNSATNQMGDPLFTRPYVECQSDTIYSQLEKGTRVLDIRVKKDRHVCHSSFGSYNIDVVINDVKRFLSETSSEIIILEVRTEHGEQDPPNFETYLVEQLGQFLIHQDDSVFGKTISELLPRRIICVWKPRNSPQPQAGGLLWSGGYLRDEWVNTEMPYTKFIANMNQLSGEVPVTSRTFFFRVENTLTVQANNPFGGIGLVTEGIRRHARLFISQSFSRGLADRLQIFSTDFINEDFVDACAGLTYARAQ
ncbi:hypothetical protein LguiA_002711 [Lonicera macranthoides]